MHRVPPEQAVLLVQAQLALEIWFRTLGQGTIQSLEPFGMSDSEIVRDVTDVCHAIYELSRYLIKLTDTASSTPCGL